MWMIQGVIEGKEGKQIVEFSLDGTHPSVGEGVYEMRFEPYSNREKKLAFHVVELRRAVADKKAA
jgi:hypothetical protein